MKEYSNFVSSKKKQFTGYLYLNIFKLFKIYIQNIICLFFRPIDFIITVDDTIFLKKKNIKKLSFYKTYINIMI